MKPQIKLCPLYEAHDGHIEMGYCDAITWICPYDGMSRNCGVYRALLKHKMLKEGIERQKEGRLEKVI